MRQFVGLIDDLSLKEVSARLAKYLLDLYAKTHTEIVDLPVTKTTLAASLGTVSETLSRTLKKMQARTIIAVEGRRIHLLDMDTLIDLAAGEKL